MLAFPRSPPWQPLAQPPKVSPPCNAVKSVCKPCKTCMPSAPPRSGSRLSGGGLAMDQNVATLKRWFEEVWNQDRIEAIDEMASPDVIAHGQAQHTVDVGLKEFREFARGIRAGFPD